MSVCVRPIDKEIELKATAEHASLPEINTVEAQLFLRVLAEGKDITFQTFDEKHADRGLAKVLHGTLEDHIDELRTLSLKGAGIFVMINEGDGEIHSGAITCRTADNVTKVRSLFVDLDGASLEPVLDCAAQPHIIVESSPGRWHVYWLVSDCSLSQFANFQKALAAKFDGDRSVIDLPRVLRLPGFLHQKGEPIRVRLVKPSASDESIAKPYLLADLSSALDLDGQGSLTRSPATDLDGFSRPQAPVLEGPLFDQSYQDGERTVRLTQLAGRYFAKGLQLGEVIALLLAWNSRNTPPLSDEKVISTCKSIEKTHLRNHPDAKIHNAERPVTPLFDLAEARIARFLDRSPPARRWLLKNCLPLGKVGALIAPGGTGKSQFLLQLGVSVATGEDFLGWEVSEPGGVLCLFAEDDDAEIHRRLHRIVFETGGHRESAPENYKRLAENLHIKSMVGEDNLMTIFDSGSREVRPTAYPKRLIEAAKAIPNLKLIVIDPGSRFRGGEENSSQDTTRFIEMLEAISQATGANVLVAHHANKMSIDGREPSQSAQRGSSAFTDGVRWQMNLAAPTPNQLSSVGASESDKRYYLLATVVKNNYGPPGENVLLKRVEDGYLIRVEPSSTWANRDNDTLELIGKVIKSESHQGRYYSRTKFEDEFGGVDGQLKMSKGRLRKLLKDAVGNGKLGEDKKRNLVPATAMSSRQGQASDKIDSKTIH